RQNRSVTHAKINDAGSRPGHQNDARQRIVSGPARQFEHDMTRLGSNERNFDCSDDFALFESSYKKSFKKLAGSYASLASLPLHDNHRIKPNDTGWKFGCRIGIGQ